MAHTSLVSSESCWIWVMSHVDESCHGTLLRWYYMWVMFNETLKIWGMSHVENMYMFMSHAKYIYICQYIYIHESCHMCVMSNVTLKIWGMSHVEYINIYKYIYTYMSHVTCESCLKWPWRYEWVTVKICGWVVSQYISALIYHVSHVQRVSEDMSLWRYESQSLVGHDSHDISAQQCTLKIWVSDHIRHDAHNISCESCPTRLWRYEVCYRWNICIYICIYIYESCRMCVMSYVDALCRSALLSSSYTTYESCPIRLWWYKARHAWMSRVTCESCHIWMSHVAVNCCHHCTSHVSHVPYDSDAMKHATPGWVMSHVRHVTYGCVMSQCMAATTLSHMSHVPYVSDDMQYHNVASVRVMSHVRHVTCGSVMSHYIAATTFEMQ